MLRNVGVEPTRAMRTRSLCKRRSAVQRNGALRHFNLQHGGTITRQAKRSNKKGVHLGVLLLLRPHSVAFNIYTDLCDKKHLQRDPCWAFGEKSICAVRSRPPKGERDGACEARKLPRAKQGKPTRGAKA